MYLHCPEVSLRRRQQRLSMEKAAGMGHQLPGSKMIKGPRASNVTTERIVLWTSDTWNVNAKKKQKINSP